jgi:membrane dipeptidase
VRPCARHLTDDELRAVAAKGGVVGVWPLARQHPEPLEQAFLPYVRHVARVAGIDHMGIATDMTGMATYTSVLTYTEFAAVPAALLASGFSEGETRKLLGENVLRVVEQSLGASRRGERTGSAAARSAGR